MPRTHNVPIPVYVDGDHERTKSHPLAKPWLEVCQSRGAFMWVMFSPTAKTSRWGYRERKRPWRVVSRARRGAWYDAAFCATLDAAVRRAGEWARL